MASNSIFESFPSYQQCFVRGKSFLDMLDAETLRQHHCCCL
uniref:Uncharacterized protein n=1 Tax=Naja naja TaxID=35670 RepID=A0A8C6VQS8_NAJNA